MNTQEKKLQAYNEAKDVCKLYISYKGDKRNSFYKRIESYVSEVAACRVNNLGRQLGLPTFNELRGL